MATRNNLSYQEPEGASPSLPASLKLLRANLTGEKKRISVGLFDNRPPTHPTNSRIVWCSTHSPQISHITW